MLTWEQQQLASQHLDLVARLAWPFARQSGRDVDELVSAGMVGLVEAAGRWRPSGGAAFRSFAVARIKGAIVDFLRVEQRYQRQIAAAKDTHDASPGDPDPDLSHLDVDGQLGRFDPRTRRILRARMRGYTQEQIAAVIGVHPSRVSQIETKARNALLNRQPTRQPVNRSLTRKERAVLVAAAQGLTGPEFAAKTGRSLDTIKTQRQIILRKLSARNITHAVALALAQGDISLKEVVTA